MRLQEWAKDWPYISRSHANGLQHTPDSTANEDHRRMAWRLSDVVVQSVTGGTLWFAPRRYRVTCYALDSVTAEHTGRLADDALYIAEQFVAQHAAGAVHISAMGTNYGVYIVRPDDNGRRGYNLDFGARADSLKRWDWWLS